MALVSWSSLHPFPTRWRGQATAPYFIAAFNKPPVKCIVSSPANDLDYICWLVGKSSIFNFEEKKIFLEVRSHI